MFKKSILTIFLVLFIAIIHLDTCTPAILIKIAILDWTKVSSSYSEFQEKYKDLNKKKEHILNIVKKEELEIGKLEKEIEGVILEHEILRKQNLIIQKRSELQTFYNEAMKILNKREEKLVNAAKENINNAIKEIAIKKGISLVFSKSGILYAAEAYVDISAEVIELLNKNYKKQD